MNDKEIKRLSDATLRRFRDALAGVTEELVRTDASTDTYVEIQSLRTMAEVELRKRELASLRSIMGKPLPLRDKTPA